MLNRWQVIAFCCDVQASGSAYVYPATISNPQLKNVELLHRPIRSGDGDRRKVESMTDETPASTDASDQSKNTSKSGDEAPKPRRGRKPKSETVPTSDEPRTNPEAPVSDASTPVKPKRTYTRRKPKVEKPGNATPESTPAVAPEATPKVESAGEMPPTPKPRRRSPSKKVEGEQAPGSLDGMTRITQEATHASSEPTQMPATSLSEVATPSEPKHESEKGGEDGGDGQQSSQEGQGRRRRHNSKSGGPSFGSNGGGNSGGNGNNGNGTNGNNGRRQNSYGNNNYGSNNNRRRNRRSGQQEVAGPSLTREELLEMKVADLRSKAAELGVDYVGVRKSELVESIYLAAARVEGFRTVVGVLEIGNEGYGWIRTGNYMEGEDDAFVHQSIIRQYGLRPGDRIEGSVGPGRSNSKYPPLQNVRSVNDREPESMKSRPRFRDLTPIYPNEALIMENGRESITGRAIDLVAPIGKGQRGLIVSPPKAGKTTVLKKICQSIAANNPEVHLFCLLVDERPEEVTDMERSIRGTVVASTFDMPAENHTHVSELVIEHAKRLVEQGEDVGVVLDSITRLARAYNLAQPASGRILSGGVDSAALYPPKKFLGAARNIENGGSLTIIASALVDTGSKMDEVIFEEFKGTGNMELKLDRDLADKRIFPAIDPVSSGTRNEDLLISPEIQPFVWGIRRILANMNNTERSATALVKGLKATNSNEEFLIRSAKKAQQSDYLGV